MNYAAENNMPNNEKLRKFKSMWHETDRERLLYLWVKQGLLNLSEFQELLEIHISEHNHNMDLGD